MPYLSPRNRCKIFGLSSCQVRMVILDRNSQPRTARSTRSLRDLPDLREDHHRLVSSAASHISRYELVNEETDRMTNSLNTLAEQVAHWMTLERIRQSA